LRNVMWYLKAPLKKDEKAETCSRRYMSIYL